MVNNKLVDIAGLGRYHENLKALLNAKENAGAAAQALADAKADAASLYQVKGEYEAAGAAAQALADAKADAASLYQVKGEYEEAGAAADALDAAKEYADGKFQVKGDYEAAGSADAALAAAKTYADGLNTAMDARVVVLEAIDHDKLASDAAAAAVATVLDGAPEAFDTLKEVADWISNNETAADAAALVTRVAALEAIEHNAYVAADEVVLAAAKKHADDEIAKLSFDEAGTAKTLADAAEQNAKDYADGKFQVKGNYETTGAAAQALADAKAYTDGEVAKKQDTIEDLATIRSGAAAGATALQESDLVFATEDEIDDLFA